MGVNRNFPAISIFLCNQAPSRMVFKFSHFDCVAFFLHKYVSGSSVAKRREVTLKVGGSNPHVPSQNWEKVPISLKFASLINTKVIVIPFFPHAQVSSPTTLSTSQY